VGLSWLARSFGISLTALVGISLIGMVAASAVAFFAMIKDIRQKWPAAVVLVCAGPMALDVLRSLPDVVVAIRYLGISFGVSVAGTIATVGMAISIVAKPIPDPPPSPPVAPARVVD
jgi:hypothetical protein